MEKVKFWETNRDFVEVTGVATGSAAWTAAEDFLNEINLKEESEYSTGLPHGENLKPNEDGVYLVPVKDYTNGQ